jgi:hypothetical protein
MYITRLGQAPDSGTPVSTKPVAPDCQLPMWLLEYEGSPANSRCIRTTDKDFENSYVGWNIVDSTATVNLDDGKILRWEIRYKDGRSTLIDANTVPSSKVLGQGVQVSLLSTITS